MIYAVLFICGGNHVRSTFAELFLIEMFAKRETDIAVSSGGFLPPRLKDLLNQNKIPTPEPFYNRPMSEVTKTTVRFKRKGGCFSRMRFSKSVNMVFSHTF